MIEVVTGVEESGYVEIKAVEKIKPDAKIVIKGAFNIFQVFRALKRMISEKSFLYNKRDGL